MITVDRFGASAIGAEVLGVDRDQLLDDESLPAAVLEALAENGVLVFRGLYLDDDTQVAFCDKLGEVVKSPSSPKPGIMRVSADPAKNPIARYLRGNFNWHLDGAMADVPTKATVLTAHAVAGSGGETEFASTYGAYDNLSAAEKDRFESVRVIHSSEAAYRLAYPDPPPEQEADWRTGPRKEQPLVWSQRNGRRSLVLGATADLVVGMGVAEGRALLDDLLARATEPGRVYRHEWAVGDTVIWDNRGLLHRARPYASDSPRDMHRTTLVGDEPIQ
jgi:alpha-ketoglutarate-dependent taurine dioxygenase